MSKAPKKRPRPSVTFQEIGPDGNVINRTGTWEEVFGRYKESTQITFESVHLYNTHLANESDRAVAVLGPAYLDTVLEDVLRKVLLEGSVTNDLLKIEGPIGTYGARVKLASALGLISADACRELQLIGQIRNRFAHRVHIHSFNEPEIKEVCSQLKSYTSYPFAPGTLPGQRGIFLMSLIAMVAELANAMEHARPAVPAPPRQDRPNTGLTALQSDPPSR